MKKVSSMNIFQSQCIICCVFLKLCFHVVHKNASIRWSNLSTYFCLWYLFVKLKIKFKEIIFKKKLSHFSYVFYSQQNATKMDPLGISSVALNFSRKWTVVFWITFSFIYVFTKCVLKLRDNPIFKVLL